jgi:hypothetical protein
MEQTVRMPEDAASTDRSLDAAKDHDVVGAETTPAPAEGQREYPQGIKFAVVMIGLCLSVFCIALDTNIIATAIPRITDDFHALQGIPPALKPNIR